MIRDKVNLLNLAEQAARQVGDALKNQAAIVVKNLDKDVKIDVDKKAHEIACGTLASSNIPVISEEDESYNFISNLQWIVDPLDGSLNFLRGIPVSCVSIGLWENGKPILGVVYDFNRQELFKGIVGEGAWLNDVKITISNIENKGDAVIMTGFPAATDFSSSALEEYILNVQTFKKVRLIGSAALSLAYVACGRADAYYEKSIRIWDVAGGLALVKAAGGRSCVMGVDKEGKCTATADNAKLQ